jgi:hypothetical protein
VDRYSGPDQDVPGPDGIGDTPFEINATEADRYPLMTPWVDHTVTFLETGLPSGSEWSVVLNGTTYTSSTNSLVVFSTVGAFTRFVYSIAPADGAFPTPSAGAGEFGNGSVVVPVAFRPPEYLQTFTITGLPANTTWLVALDGTTFSGPSQVALDISLANGTYDYTIGRLPGYLVTPDSGVLRVTGSRANLTFRAALFLFQVRFVESGLPLGLSWNLAVDGATAYSSSDVDAFVLPNGTYAFTVNASAGYDPTPSAGSFTIQGSGGALYVHFALSGSSSFPPPGGGGASPAGSDYWPYEVAIGVAAGVGAIGWILAAVYRRRLGRRRP